MHDNKDGKGLEKSPRPDEPVGVINLGIAKLEKKELN